IESALDVPPLRGTERHALALALDDEARGDGLHASGREPTRDLLPEDGRDLVAVEPVENAARLLRVDEPLVDVAGIAERALDRVAGDLVEDHPAHRQLGLQYFLEVPCDRFALAVLVRREQELVGARKEPPQLRDLLPLG